MLYKCTSKGFEICHVTLTVIAGPSSVVAREYKENAEIEPAARGKLLNRQQYV